MVTPLLYFGIVCNKRVKNYFTLQGGLSATPHEIIVMKKQKIELEEAISLQTHLEKRFDVKEPIVMLYLETMRCEYLNKGGVNRQYLKGKRKQPDYCDRLKNILQQMNVAVEEDQEFVLSNWERYEGAHQDMCTNKNNYVINPDPLYCLEKLSFQQQIPSRETLQNISVQCP